MNIGIEALMLNPRRTGIGCAIENLLAGLSRSATDEQFTVYAPPCPGLEQLPKPARTAWVTVKCAGNRFGRALWREWRLRRALRRDRAGLLHSTAYLLPQDPDLPAILTVHDIFAITHPEWVPWLNAVNLEENLGRSVQQATKVIASSAFTAGELARVFATPARKIEVVPIAVADHFFEPVTQERLRTTRERYDLPHRYVLFVGNVEPKKNLQTLLDAMERVWHDQPDVKLVQVGPGGWKSGTVLRRLTDLERAGNVKRIGWVVPKDLPAVYAGSVLAAMPSLGEGFGMPVVEAMASGTAVVTSDAPGLAEARGEATTTVKAQDTEGLAREILALLRDENLRAQRIEAGRKHASRFRVIEYGRKHLELYHQLLDN